MIPFQYTYLFVVLLAFTIYAGNTAYPIYLRLLIWLGRFLVPITSRLHETLTFILDHPRRVYIVR